MSLNTDNNSIQTLVLKNSIKRFLNSVSIEIDDSIHVLSLQELNQNNVLLRLEYFFENNGTKSKSEYLAEQYFYKF